jgi:hypothetical protein
MDHLATVFVDELKNLLPLSVVLLILGCPERSSASTDIQQALKHECHPKTAVRLKVCTLKASVGLSRVLEADLPAPCKTLCTPKKKLHGL